MYVWFLQLLIYVQCKQRGDFAWNVETQDFLKFYVVFGVRYSHVCMYSALYFHKFKQNTILLY